MKRYRNIGTAPLGLTYPPIIPGAEFTAELDSQQENFLKRIGAIEEVVAAPPAEDTPPSWGGLATEDGE